MFAIKCAKSSKGSIYYVLVHKGESREIFISFDMKLLLQLVTIQELAELSVGEYLSL